MDQINKLAASKDAADGNLPTSTNIFWTLGLKVTEGKADTFKSLGKEMSAVTIKEEGALVYEWFLDDSGENCNIYERFQNNDAVMIHLGNFGAFAERFTDCVEVTCMTVYGPVNEEVKSALEGFSPIYMSQFAGFLK